MSDIRKDFETFAATKDMPIAKIVNNFGETVYKNWCVQDAFEAYQAGRADDIEGLIAEIEGKCKYSNAITTGQSCINAAINEAISIIRKHFGGG